jgi:transcription antitermination factor NusG
MGVCGHAASGFSAEAQTFAIQPEARDSARWFALTVRHQHERPVQAALEYQGWRTWVPLYRSRRQWSDRVKEIEAPLFAGYVLCRFALLEKVRVLNTPGVTRLVGFGGVPAPLEETEVARIQAVLGSGLPVRPWPFLQAGDAVRVERGPLRGLEGTVLKEKDGLRLVIAVELLRRSMCVDLEADMVVPAPARATPPRLRSPAWEFSRPAAGW